MQSEIWKTFDSISKSYDRINRILSFGIDLYWRNTVSQHIPKKNSLQLLDCATGTGDQIFSIASKIDLQLGVGIDLAYKMLEIAKEKLEKLPYKEKISFQEASLLAIPFPEESYDLVTISFGIRNVSDVDLGLKEMLRVLKKDGKALILEFSMPKNTICKKLYLLYLRHVLPLLGRLLSRHHQAYRYLNESIESFPSGKDFCKKMEDAGFKEVRYYPLTFGIATLYEGYR